MPFAGNLAADFLSVSLSDKLWDAHVKQYEMKPSVDLKPQATFVQRHRLLCIQLTSSPGLHWPINFQPYGFQLWLLADVCPTHHSIWFTGDLLSPFGNFGEFYQILIISLHQVDWCFPKGGITAQCGYYLCMKVNSVACSASNHSWESLPMLTCKICVQIRRIFVNWLNYLFKYIKIITYKAF